MPWSSAQHRLFEAVKHDPALAKEKGISQEDAGRMASEGIKDEKKSRLSRLYKDKK